MPCPSQEVQMTGLKVTLNEKPMGTIPWKTSLSAAKDWVAENVTYTHMGEWRKLDDGFEYATTVGAYYKFEVVQ